jgi:hypothetical protein
LSSRQFITHYLDGLRRRTYKNQSSIKASLGKVSALSQKSISRVDTSSTRALSDINQFLDDQVAFQGLGWSDMVRLICISNMGRIPVDVRIDGYCRYAQFVASSDNPHGYLATIGNEQLVNLFAQ